MRPTFVKIWVARLFMPFRFYPCSLQDLIITRIEKLVLDKSFYFSRARYFCLRENIIFCNAKWFIKTSKAIWQHSFKYYFNCQGKFLFFLSNMITYFACKSLLFWQICVKFVQGCVRQFEINFNAINRNIFCQLYKFITYY